MLDWKKLLLKLAYWLADQVMGRLLAKRQPQVLALIDAELAQAAPDPGLVETVIGKSIEKVTGAPATSSQIGALILKYSPVAAAKAEQAIVAHLNR